MAEMKNSLVCLQQCEQDASPALHRIQLHRTKKKVIYSSRIYKILKQLLRLCDFFSGGIFKSDMADMEVLMMEALKNLADLEFKFLKYVLHVVKYGDGKTIPFSELEKADFMDLSRKICSYYYPNQVQVLIEALKYINRNDLAEKLRNQVETEKRKNDNQIVDSDGSPAKKQRLGGPATYDGRYNLSDLEDYASKNQDQLIKQLEEYLEPDGMRILKEQLAHSKLKNSFVFTAKQFYELHSNNALIEFKKNILSMQKSQNIPKKILATLFSTVESNNKSALDKKWRKDNSESKNQRNSLPSNKGNGSMPISPNASHLGLNDNDGEKKMPNLSNANYTELNNRDGEEKILELVNDEKTDEGVLYNGSLTGAVEETRSSESQVPKAEEKMPEPVNEKTDEGALYTGESLAHADKESVEETQRSESQVSKADNSLYDKAIRILCNEKKVEVCGFDYIGVRKHKKYECFVAENVIQFKLPGNTEYGLLQILQKKNDITGARKLTKNVKFELQFNMAVLGIQSSVAISPMKDFIETVAFTNSFPEFEKFFKDVVDNIVLPLLAFYKMVQVECLQITLDNQRSMSKIK